MLSMIYLLEKAACFIGCQFVMGRQLGHSGHLAAQTRNNHKETVLMK